MITILEFPLVFIIGLVYWTFGFASENVFVYIVIGDFVVLFLSFVITVVRFLFGRHKIKMGRKLAKNLFLSMAWLLSEAVAVFYFTIANKPIGW